MTASRIGRIVSGGQSGVDRAALDFAIANGIPYGGWCPRGGWAEDLTSPPGLLALYPALRATPDANPAQRTRWNVRDSDGTLILTRAAARSPGAELTERAAVELGRPFSVVDLRDPAGAEARIEDLLAALPAASVLNVAGPRESEAPGIYEHGVRLLEARLLIDPARARTAR